MKRLLRQSSFLAVLAVMIPLSAARAATPNGENITASPTQISADLQPGATIKGASTIINDGDQAYSFKAYAAPYKVTGENYDQSFNKAAGATDASDWIHVDARIMHLEPHQSMSVPYTITVPTGTGGGGYYGTIFYETLPKQVAGSGVATTRRVGSVVYMRVDGEIIERGSIESFIVGFFQAGAPVPVDLRLRNDGNVHYSADITQRIVDVFGHTKYELHVSRKVLPQTTRRFDLSWQRAPSFGLFRVGGSVTMLDRTEQLPWHYILIVSPVAFVSAVAGLLVIVGLLVWWLRGRRKVARETTAS